MNNRIPLLVEKLCQQPVPVGMAAYFQNRIQQCGDVYRSGRSSWRELYCLFRFHCPFPSCCGHRRMYLQRCHRRSCDDCLVHDFIILIVNTRALAARRTTRALRRTLPVRQGFRGKYRSRNGEDDFPRNLKGLTLQAEQGGALPLPVNWNDRAICLSRF